MSPGKEQKRILTGGTAGGGWVKGQQARYTKGEGSLAPKGHGGVNKKKKIRGGKRKRKKITKLRILANTPEKSKNGIFAVRKKKEKKGGGREGVFGSIPPAKVKRGHGCKTDGNQGGG